MKTKKLILFGDSAFAEIAYEYFTHDSEYEVVAFTVSQEYLKKTELFGLPVVPFETVEQTYSPQTHEMHLAIVYLQMNRVRMKFYEAAKAKGYTMANYISSKAFVWKNVTMGDNVFIFEDNTIQPFVRIGSNNVFWSGNHIGHHSVIGDHNFFSSHVVISGFCNIGNSGFFGVNCTVGNNIDIGDDCLFGSFTHLVKNVGSGRFVRGVPSVIETQSTYEKFGIDRV